MSDYLKRVVESFEKFPVGTRVTGTTLAGDEVTGYVGPVGFGVRGRPSDRDFGRAYVRVHDDEPVREANGNMRFSGMGRTVWADTIAAPEPEPRGVVAHLLVEVAFKRGELISDALQIADNLVDDKLSHVDFVESFYIRQLGVSPADD